jgi:hypothetical protein
VRDAVRACKGLHHASSAKADLKIEESNMAPPPFDLIAGCIHANFNSASFNFSGINFSGFN